MDRSDPKNKITRAAAAGEIDRQADAVLVIGSLQQARGKAVVLHGKRGAGKSELLRNWVVPLLAKDESVYYAECAPGLPDKFQCAGAEMPVDWGALPPGIILLDDFDQLLCLPEPPKQQELQKFVSALRTKRPETTLAVVVCDDSLREIFALRSAAPEIARSLFDLPEVSLDSSLTLLAASEPGGAVAYDPSLLKALQQDLDHFNLRTSSPDLVQAIHAEFCFKRTREPTTASRLEADLREIGGLKGLLSEFASRKLEELGEARGPAAREAGQAILEEVVANDGFKNFPNVENIAARLGVPAQTVTGSLEWLKEPQGLLRGTLGGRLDTRPIQLIEIICAQTEARRKEFRHPQRLLAEAVRSWKELGGLPPKERFTYFHQARKELRTNTEEEALMACCALRYAEGSELAPARYWITRIQARSAKITVLFQALFNEHPGSRRRAAALSGELDEPELRHQLYRTALEDPDEQTRQAAVSSLQRLGAAEFRDRLEDEASDPDNPYRQNAVEALRIFPDQRTAATLQGFVNDPATKAAIRTAAIDTLAVIQTPASVEALVNIGLLDEDREDRESALAALGKIESESLNAIALEKIRNTPLDLRGKREPLRAVTLLLAAAKLFAAILVAVVNFILHGFALLFLRRYWLAAGFFVVEVASFGIVEVSERGDLPWLYSVGVLVFYVNYLASQLVSFKTTEEGDQKKQAGFRFKAMLRLMMFLGNAVSTVLLFHGFAHLMVKRTRRGLVLFGLEMLTLGVICVLAWVMPDLFNIAGLPATGTSGRFEKILYQTAGWFYIAGFCVFFAGTYLWDVTVAAYLAFLPWWRAEAKQRRDAAYKAVLGSPKGAVVLVSALRSTDRDTAREARGLARRFVHVIPPGELVEELTRRGPNTPAAVIDVLASAKGETVLRNLSKSWPDADLRTRQRIWQVLANKPTESSLRYLQKLLPRAGFTDRLRYLVSAFNYRVRVLPKSLLSVAGYLLPLCLILLYEAVATFQNQERPLLRKILTYPTSNTYPPIFSSPPHFSKACVFLAELYPDKSADALVKAFQSLDQPGREHLEDCRSDLLKSLCFLATKGTMNTSSNALAALRESLDQATNNSSWHIMISMTVVEISRNSNLEYAHTKKTMYVHTKKTAQGILAGNVHSYRKVLFSSSSQTNTPNLKSDALQALQAADSKAAVEVLGEFLTGRGAPEVVQTRSHKSKAAGPLRLGSQPALDKDSEQLKQEALECLSQMETPEALEALTKFAVGPGGIEQRQIIIGLLFDEAQTAINRDNDARAAKYLEHATKIDPANTRATRLRAAICAVKARKLYDSNSYDAALLESRKALDADPKYEWAYEIQVRIQLARTNRAGARQSLIAATNHVPDFTWAIYNLAHMAYEDTNYNQAAQLALQAVATKPDDSASFDLLRQIYMDQKGAGETVNRFERLSHQYPNSIWPRMQLASLYHEYIARTNANAYKLAYEINKQLHDEAEEHPADREGIEANFIEGNLTTGRHGEAVKLARDLTAETQEPDFKIAMRVVAYAALVVQGDYKAASKELDDLEKAWRDLTAADQTDWGYDGTLNYLQNSSVPENMKSPLVKLVSAINESNKESNQNGTRALPPGVFKENRAALKTAPPKKF